MNSLEERYINPIYRNRHITQNPYLTFYYQYQELLDKVKNSSNLTDHCDQDYDEIFIKINTEVICLIHSDYLNLNEKFREFDLDHFKSTKMHSNLEQQIRTIREYQDKYLQICHEKVNTIQEKISDRSSESDDQLLNNIIQERIKKIDMLEKMVRTTNSLPYKNSFKTKRTRKMVLILLLVFIFVILLILVLYYNSKID